MRMRLLAVGLALLIWAPHVQGQFADYPTKKEISGVLQDVDYALRRFEEASSQVSIRRWRAPNELIQGLESLLESLRGTARRMKGRTESIHTKVRNMEVIEGSDRLSGFDLFMLYQDWTALSFGVGSLAVQADLFRGENSEGAALMGARVATHTANSKLFRLLQKQLLAEELELRICRDTR